MLGFMKDSRNMTFITKSIRMKLLLLVMAIAIVVGLAAVVYDVVAGGNAIDEQLVKRGRYIASNLAFNAKYGVLTEDRPLLVNLLQGATGAGSEDESSDVVGAMVRDASGEVLAQVGEEIRGLPTEPAAKVGELETETTTGEAVYLFRAPVTTGGDGSGLSEELGGAARAEAIKGGVEVAISKAGIDRIQNRRLLEALLIGLLFVALGAVAAMFLTGRWLSPLQDMARASEAVAKGDLTVKIESDSGDEVGILGRSLNEMVGNLRGVADNIQDASVQVASSAGQISANARLINEGAQGQAQAAEETSTSMEEMAASIQTVAGSAQGLAAYVEVPHVGPR